MPVEKQDLSMKQRSDELVDSNHEEKERRVTDLEAELGDQQNQKSGRKRRSTRTIPSNQMWMCPNECGKKFKKTSIQSINAHMEQCNAFVRKIVNKVAMVASQRTQLLLTQQLHSPELQRLLLLSSGLQQPTQMDSKIISESDASNLSGSHSSQANLDIHKNVLNQNLNLFSNLSDLANPSVSAASSLQQSE